MIKRPSLAELVKRDKVARFVYYRAGFFYYQVDDFAFPIPLSDIGNATLHLEEKALLLMRYIRGHLKTLEEKP